MSKLLESIPSSLVVSTATAASPYSAPKRATKLDNQTLDIIRAESVLHMWDTNSRFLERLAIEHGIVMSLSTLRRARRILGLRRCVAVTKPHLDDNKKTARLLYAQSAISDNIEWRKVIYTDEVPLYVDQLYQAHVPRPRGSNRLDEQYIQYTWRSGTPSVMVWGAIWYGGRSPLVRFDTSESTGKRKGVTAEINRTQITEGPLIDVWKRVKAVWRGYGLPWVVEDNAPVHKAKAT